MIKWIIKHYNAITVCLAIVTLYLLVQFLQRGIPLKLNSLIIWWGLMNIWANKHLSDQVSELVWEYIDNEKADYDVYIPLLRTNIRALRIAFAYAVGSLILLIYGYYQNFIIH